MKKLSILALGFFLFATAAMALASGQDKAANAGPLTGSWQCVSHGGPDGDTKFTLDLQQDGEKITGSVDSDEGGMDITSGTFKEDNLEIRLETPQGNYVLKAKLKDGQLAGQVTLDDKAQGNWEGKKAAAEDTK
ncbi:MAG TPA: hypothetical protein VG028_16620 [Terriglobia bacterium]|nr:hypothetical protein [Terriglobia bacterium]